MPIRFFSTHAGSPWLVFSNLHRAPFTLENKVWPSVEHYFQAQKFTNKTYQEAIRITPHAVTAKRLGGSRRQKIRSEWEEVKEEVMRTALRAKFEGNPKLKELLLGTGTQQLIEASPYDSYWGEGRNGKGQNRLGELLMDLREDLKTK